MQSFTATAPATLRHFLGTEVFFGQQSVHFLCVDGKFQTRAAFGDAVWRGSRATPLFLWVLDIHRNWFAVDKFICAKRNDRQLPEDKNSNLTYSRSSCVVSEFLLDILSANQPVLFVAIALSSDLKHLSLYRSPLLVLSPLAHQARIFCSLKRIFGGASDAS